jgi:iron(II)-dependent oxidoreductase
VRKRRTKLPGARRAGVAAALLLAGPVLAGLGASADVPPPDYAALDLAPLAEADAPHSRAANEAMVRIPAGTYPIGRDDGPRDQRPAHTVRLPAFRIDRTEVTNAAFAEFLNATSLTPTRAFAAGELRAEGRPDAVVRRLVEGPEGTGNAPIIALDDAQARIGWRDGRFRPTEGHGDHPVTETTWAGARAYCRWRGGRLPSEVAWEAAARGMAGRRYPWGDAPPTEARAFVSGRTGVTAPVGSHPAGATPRGVLDLSGSLAEWTASLKRPYPYDPDDGREDPDAPGERVTRGGDYIYDTSRRALSATHRDGFSNAPARGHRHIGFRCAADATGPD